MPYDSSNKMNYGGPKMHKGGPHMESVKQERSNLLHDNPVAKDASGGRPWIAKHFKSTMSPLKEGHEGGSPMSKHDGKEFGDEGFMDTHFKSGKPRNEGPQMKMGEGPEMKYGDGPEMGHLDSPAEAHCMGPRMENKGSAFRKEFSIEEAKKKMEERKKREKAKEEAKK
jgi:hypothetical protein